MQLKVGDKVRFLNEVGEGTVVGLLDAQTAMVRTEDGFDIPTLIRDLIVASPPTRYGHHAAPEPPADRLGKANRNSPPEGQTSPQPTAEGAGKPVEKASPHIPLRVPAGGAQRLSLGFAPLDELDTVAGPFRMYAINEGQRHMMLTLARWEGSQLHTLFAAKLKPNCARYVTTIEARDLFLYAAMRAQALYFSDQAMEPIPPETIDVELKLSRFMRPGSFQTNRFLGEPLLTLTVLAPETPSELPSQPGEAEGAAPPPAGMQPDSPPSPTSSPTADPQGEEMILNLQMAALAPAQLSLPPEEQLAFQMRHFARGMMRAMANATTRRVVAIHGLGNSQLRRAVINALRSEYPQCRHQDASFKEYDYGATLILLPPSA